MLELKAERLRRALDLPCVGWREFAVVSAGFLAILGALFWRVVFLQEVLTPADLIYSLDPVWRAVAPPDFRFPSNHALSDLVFQWYPWLTFNGESLRQGVIPLWNPFVLGGTPYLANQQSAFLYPINLLLYFLPMPVSIGYLAIVRLLVAGLSTYYYLRTLGAGRSGCFVGACAFTFGGFSIVWLGYAMSNIIVLLPLALLLTEKLFRRGGGPWFAGLALVIAAQLLGGHPETSFHFGLIWAVYALFRLSLEVRHRAAWSSVGWLSLQLGASCLLGFAIASVQVLPFLAILPDTFAFAARQGGTGGDWLVHPGLWKELVSAVTIVFPNALGNPTVPNATWFGPFMSPNEQAVYVGTTPLVLAIIGATTWRRSPYVAFWLGAVVVYFGLAYHLPGFEAANHLPVFGIAYSGRLRLGMTIGAAVLAAFGTDLLVQKIGDAALVNKVKKMLLISALLGLCGALAVFGGLLVFRDFILGYGTEYVTSNVYGQPGYPESLEYYRSKLTDMYDALLRFYSPLAVRVYLPILFATGLWLTLVACGGKCVRRTVIKASLVVLTVVDLMVLAWGYNPSIDAKQVYPETEVIRFLRERADGARVAGIGLALMPNANMVWGLRDVRGYENISSRRFETFFDALATRLPFGAYSLLAKPSPRLFELLGVKYVVAQKGDVHPTSELSLVFASEGVEIFENPSALPRAFVVGRARKLDSEEAILEEMRSPSFRPREEVLFEGTMPVLGNADVRGNASARDVNANEVHVSVSADAAAWLVLSDAYEDGWKAFVDGREVKVYRANYIMRAVRVEAGQHLVEFRYEPTAFAIGLRVSVAALLITGLIGVYSTMRSRAAYLRLASPGRR